MQTTINIDNNLLTQAQEIAGSADKTKIMDMALRALIDRGSILYMAQMGGSQPHLQQPRSFSIDANLLARAQKIVGNANKSKIMGLALRAMIERHSAACLARMGGSQPHLKQIVRRRLAC